MIGTVAPGVKVRDLDPRGDSSYHHTENVDRFLGFHQVGNAVVAIKEYPNLAIANALVSIAELRILPEDLSALVDSLHNARR